MDACAELTPDKIIFNYVLTKPYGEPDEKGSIEIDRHSIDTINRVTMEELHKRQEDNEGNNFCTVNVPEINTTFVLYYYRWQESIARCSEMLYGGVSVLKKE